MPLSPSWKTHFLQGLAPLNAIDDRNVSKYTKAMTYNAAMDTKMKYLNEDHNLILVADHKKQVIILHNLKTMAAPFSSPTTKSQPSSAWAPTPTSLLSMQARPLPHNPNVPSPRQTSLQPPPLALTDYAPFVPPPAAKQTTAASPCLPPPHSSAKQSSKQ